MGLPSSRFLLLHRVLLLPPLVLLTLTCLYTSSSLTPFSTSTQHVSFLQGMQCLSCESSSSLTYRSFLSRTLAAFPTSLHVRGTVPVHVEDSRGEAKDNEPVSRPFTDEVESVDGLESNENNARNEVDTSGQNTKLLMNARLAQADEETSARTDTSSEEPLVKQQSLGEEEDEETLVRVEVRTNPPRSDVKLSNDDKVHGDSDTLSEAGEVEFLSENKENFEGSKIIEELENSVPAGNHVHSSVETVQFSFESEENFEGDTRGDLPLESRPFTSDDHSRSDEHAHTLSEENVGITEVVPAPPSSKELEIAASGYPFTLSEYVTNTQKLVDGLAKSGLPTQSVNSPNERDLDVNVPLRGESRQGVPLPESSCEGRHAYVYTLPSKFNIDLAAQCDLVSWFSVCDYFINEGMGRNVPTNELNDRGEQVLVPDGSWFQTHQYALELTFHSRLMHYPCLTADVNQADLFFVPYYGSLDVARYQFGNKVSIDQQDELGLELMSWLEGQDSWSRNNGIDHVFVLGKIGWDFRRVPPFDWGSRLLRLPAMEKPTKVLIERDPWHEQDIGVPHPTFFHPKDNNEIRTWLAHVEQSERRYLVSFAGMPRPDMSGNVRGHLIQHCLDHKNDCSLLRCVKDTCMRPDQTMNLFLHSHFCMQPPGDSSTRRSVFDSLVGGCIPVLFDPYTAYIQYPWHLPRNMSSYSVFIPSENVISGNADIVRILKSINPEERTEMRTRIIREIIPGLLYCQPGTNHSDFRDAFDISLEALFRRLANLRAEKALM